MHAGACLIHEDREATGKVCVHLVGKKSSGDLPQQREFLPRWNKQVENQMPNKTIHFQ